MGLKDILTKIGYKRSSENYECNSKDIILAENRYLSFDRMKTRRNSSVFAYAAPGSSILKSLIEPNILQANASFIVPDHENYLSGKYKDFLIEKGYTVKIVDFCFNRTDTSNMQIHYNPFCYIKETADIAYLVNTIIEKTALNGDFEECMRRLATISALIRSKTPNKYHGVYDKFGFPKL